MSQLTTRSRASMMAANPGKPAKMNPLEMVGRWWGKLAAWKRAALLTGILALALSGAGVWQWEKANEPVSLLATKIEPQDTRDISRLLLKNGIEPHVNSNEDGIAVAPKDRQKARWLVAEARLPRHASALPAGPDWGRTTGEAKLHRQRQLEQDISSTLRQFVDVVDADVKLAIPDGEGLFKDSPPVTAAVAVHLKAGTELPIDQVSSIINFVAASVPELAPDKVNLVDAGTGRNLSELYNSQRTRKTQLGALWQVEASYAEHLRKQAQDQLDGVLGANRSRLTVTCRFDFSEQETNSHLLGVGPAVKIGENIKTESMNKEDGEKNNKYDHDIRATKWDHNFTNTKIVKRDPRVERVNASVVFDNLPAAQVEKLKAVVEGALGLDPAQGDRLEVASVPFVRPTLEENPARRHPATLTPSEVNWAGFLAVGSLMMLLPAGFYWLKGGTRGTVGKQEMALAGRSTLTDLADLRNEKTGRSPALDLTATINDSKMLQEMANSEPKRLAAQLRQSWLNDR